MYIALARKYRPQTFSSLVGQSHVMQTLKNALKENRLYQTLIFSGIKGVGKTSAARILAKSLNCESSVDGEPCNKCDNCKSIASDAAADYIEIDGASNNGIDEVRKIREAVKYRPMSFPYRVVIIDEVHMLSISAWNALLKTIEEPPEHTYFVMATTDFHKIPSTIVSRCQHFEFKRIYPDVIVDLLKDIAVKEGVEISEYSLYLIAKAADGSLRDAQKIMDQVISFSSGKIDDSRVSEILGVIDEELFINLIVSVINKNRAKIFETIEYLSQKGLDFIFFYQEFLRFLRDLMVIKCIGHSNNIHGINPENFARIDDLLKLVKEESLLRYFNVSKEYDYILRMSENPGIMLEFMFLKLSYLSDLTLIEEILPKLQNNGSVNEVKKSKSNFNEAETKDIKVLKRDNIKKNNYVLNDKEKESTIDDKDDTLSSIEKYSKEEDIKGMMEDLNQVIVDIRKK